MAKETITNRVVRQLDEGLPDDDRPLNSRGRIVTPEASSRATLRNPDLTESIVRLPHGSSLYTQPLVAMRPESDLDALSAMQIGLGRLLQGLTFWQHNLEARLGSQDLQPRGFRLERIFFDLPRQEDDLDPMPSACILCPGERSYEQQDLSITLIEDTADVFGEGTVLRKLAHVTCELELAIWSAHNEERRGIVAGIERELLAEPNDDRAGRRVVVADYFDRVARFALLRDAYPDGGGQSNERMVQFRIAADIDRVVLVGVGRLQQPQTRVAIEE